MYAIIFWTDSDDRLYPELNSNSTLKLYETYSEALDKASNMQNDEISPAQETRIISISEISGNY